jgi:hypothetical protein
MVCLVKAVLEPLLQSPELPEYVDSLNRILALERRCREKFYEELTEDGKFEFINGQVIMHSPAKRKHINVTKNLSRLLSTFVEERELGEVYAEKALCVFPRNDYEPEVCFFSRAKNSTPANVPALAITPKLNSGPGHCGNANQPLEFAEPGQRVIVPFQLSQDVVEVAERE